MNPSDNPYDLDVFKDGRHWYAAVGASLCGPFDEPADAERAAIAALEDRWQKLFGDKE